MKTTFWSRFDTENSSWVGCGSSCERSRGFSTEWIFIGISSPFNWTCWSSSSSHQYSPLGRTNICKEDYQTSKQQPLFKPERHTFDATPNWTMDNVSCVVRCSSPQLPNAWCSETIDVNWLVEWRTQGNCKKNYVSIRTATILITGQLANLITALPLSILVGTQRTLMLTSPKS